MGIPTVSPCRKLPSVFIALSVLALPGCAAQKQFERRVDKMERGLEDIRVVQAELTARVDTLENQMRGFTGKVEELQFSQDHQLGGDVSSLKQDISRLQRRIPPPALVPQIALEEDETLARQFSAETSRLFLNELNRIRTGNYKPAVPGFERLANSLAPDDVRARAFFWLGVSREGAGDNANALRAYHSLSQNFPSHPRVPLALLRQSSVFVRLQDVKTAKLTLQKLISQFPKSVEAADARVKLKKLR